MAIEAIEARHVITAAVVQQGAGVMLDEGSGSRVSWSRSMDRSMKRYMEHTEGYPLGG
jgi:hypothetical protein